MKKIIVLVLTLALCASMTACVMMGDPGSDTSRPTVNLDAEPEILLDKNNVEQENRYDQEGNHVGYYRYTGGTNCGNPGTMLIEFLDLAGNVLNSYSPKFAGGTLAYGQFGGTSHDQFEITDIWESDYSNAVNSNSYKLVKYSGGVPYAYIENRAGCTTRCDLYGTNGQVVASLIPANPKNTMEIYHSFENYFNVVEGYSEERPEGPTFYTERQLYYDRSGVLLCEIGQIHTEDAETNKKSPTRYEVKNPAGEVLQIYEVSDMDFELEVYYDTEQGIVFATESKIDSEAMRVFVNFTEYFDPARNLVLYRVQHTYENGNRVRTEYTVCGGKVVMSDGPIEGTYRKLEFYDAQGILQETVEAPEGYCLVFTWEAQNVWVRIDTYDINGNQVGGSHIYQPLQEIK